MRNLSRAAIFIAVLAVFGGIQYRFHWPIGTGELPNQTNLPLTPNKTGNTPTESKTTVTASKTNAPLANSTGQPADGMPIAAADNTPISVQWNNLSNVKPMIAKDLAEPKYNSLPWLIEVHTKLNKVNLVKLAQSATASSKGVGLLKQVILLNDSVQWSLLKYCMEHPTAMVHKTPNYVLTNGTEDISINSMYTSIVNPELKKQSMVFYKQAVIRYIRAKEQQLVSK